MPTSMKRGARDTRSAMTAAIACALLLTASGHVPAEGWCDVVFKDVLDEASNVIIANYRHSGESLPQITVQEILKGSCTDRELDLDLEELTPYGLKNGDQLIIALTSYHQPVRVVPGMGGCTAVSVLPIRGGKLRARDRMNYDFTSKSITLETLRAELLALLRPDS